MAGRNANRRERPTLVQVAAEAGVSRATASRALRGERTVDAGLRAKVERAAEKLGYVPNAAARSLVTRRTDTVALILPEPTDRVFSDDQFFPNVIRSAAAEFEAAGKLMLLLTAGSEDGHRRIERYALSGHVDGVVFASLRDGDPLPELVHRSGIPVVCNGAQKGSSIPYVDVDHRSGVREALRHMYERGCRRIATIAGPQTMVAGRERLAAYAEESKALGTGTQIVFGDFTKESGHNAIGVLLDEGTWEDTPDAVFAASDLMAYGALQHLQQKGISVPDDIALVGFDDMEMAAFTEPGLTTVRQPIDEIGAALAKQMLMLLEGEEEIANVVLPTQLIRRGTC
ncbi:LacI family DNA-binding transcriptional regulator [Salininema proteolyticum]|uniref:LacI family DNA-binding transcriptional regulator n=1 Tax=Salininema proteolyticum TaxID=1607685 RepID=A0ABV8TYS0_9ACTN